MTRPAVRTVALSKRNGNRTRAQGGAVRGRRLLGLLARAERLGHTQSRVPLLRISPCEANQVQAEHRKIQRPVSEEQHGSRLTATTQGRQQQEHDQPVPDTKLHGLETHRRPLQTEPGPRPLDEKTFVLGSDGWLGAMNPQGNEPQKRIEVEPAQSADVASHPEIALLKQRLPGKRDQQRRRCNEQHDGRRGRLEPDDRRGRQHDLKTGSKELAREPR